MKGNIIFGIISRLSIRATVNPEHGEVTGMTGPDPVVRFTAKFSNILRWSANQPDILECFINKKIKLIKYINKTNTRNS
jgi:hypothetical protein